jgi:hypothetical protein
MIDAVGERHFSGFNTRMLVEYLTAQMGAEGRDAVLQLAGETRIPEVLGDDATWSSYGQVRRLLEATSTLFGIETLSQVALVSTNFEGRSLEGAAPMQALGSPAALLDESAASGTGMGGSSVLVAVRGELIGPSEYLVGQRFKEGFEPFAEWCVYFRGLLSIVPMLFGLPQGEVVEGQCQCRGDPACVMRLRWEEPADIDSNPESLRAKVRLLET